MSSCWFHYGITGLLFPKGVQRSSIFKLPQRYNLVVWGVVSVVRAAELTLLQMISDLIKRLICFVRPVSHKSANNAKLVLATSFFRICLWRKKFTEVVDVAEIAWIWVRREARTNLMSESQLKQRQMRTWTFEHYKNKNNRHLWRNLRKSNQEDVTMRRADWTNMRPQWW